MTESIDNAMANDNLEAAIEDTELNKSFYTDLFGLTEEKGTCNQKFLDISNHFNNTVTIGCCAMSSMDSFRLKLIENGKQLETHSSQDFNDKTNKFSTIQWKIMSQNLQDEYYPSIVTELLRLGEEIFAKNREISAKKSEISKLNGQLDSANANLEAKSKNGEDLERQLQMQQVVSAELANELQIVKDEAQLNQNDLQSKINELQDLLGTVSFGIVSMHSNSI